jgi:hypothetical protein
MIGQLLRQLLLNLCNQVLVTLGKRVQSGRNHAISFGIQFAEREILELLPHLVHAHAASKRSVNFERLVGHASPGFGRHEADRAHVV